MRFLAIAIVLAGATPSLAQETVGAAQFVADPQAYAGKTVTLGPCSLFSAEYDGQYTCRLVNPDGSDFKDASDLPVDLFLVVAIMDTSVGDSVQARCDSYGLCQGTVTVTGPVDVGILGGATFRSSRIDPVN